MKLARYVLSEPLAGEVSHCAPRHCGLPALPALMPAGPRPDPRCMIAVEKVPHAAALVAPLASVHVTAQA